MASSPLILRDEPGISIHFLSGLLFRRGACLEIAEPRIDRRFSGFFPNIRALKSHFGLALSGLFSRSYTP